MMSWLEHLSGFWHGLLQATRDDAYERYVAHWHAHHAREGGEPLNRKAFFKQEIERKWNGIKRCC